MAGRASLQSLGGRRRAERLTPERRREIARQGAVLRWSRGIAGLSAAEVGRRIEAGARNALADEVRRSYWEARGPGMWERACRDSLKARLAASWAGVVRAIGHV